MFRHFVLFCWSVSLQFCDLLREFLVTLLPKYSFFIVSAELHKPLSESSLRPQNQKFKSQPQCCGGGKDLHANSQVL